MNTAEKYKWVSIWVVYLMGGVMGGGCPYWGIHIGGAVHLVVLISGVAVFIGINFRSGCLYWHLLVFKSTSCLL